NQARRDLAQAAAQEAEWRQRAVAAEEQARQQQAETQRLQREADTARYALLLGQARHALQKNDTARARAVPDHCPTDLRAWEHAHLSHTAPGGALPLQGHTDAVTSVAFSPSGKSLASASADATARVWDRTTGAESIVLKGHALPVTCVPFHPAGNAL